MGKYLTKEEREEEAAYRALIEREHGWRFYGLLDTQAAAYDLGITQRRVLQLLKAGTIKGTFVPADGYWYIREASVKEYAAARQARKEAHESGSTQQKDRTVRKGRRSLDTSRKGPGKQSLS